MICGPVPQMPASGGLTSRTNMKPKSADRSSAGRDGKSIRPVMINAYCLVRSSILQRMSIDDFYPAYSNKRDNFALFKIGERATDRLHRNSKIVGNIIARDRQY